jgi:predicted SAM-dependent methyltransferase
MVKISTKSYKYIYFFLKRFFKKQKKSALLHLGCGNIYIDNYINIDISHLTCADKVIDIKKVPSIYSYNTIDEVLMIHSISYLRIWEVELFLSGIFKILKKGGRLILEFPDIQKCSKILNESSQIDQQYLEALRAVFAYDNLQVQNKIKYTTYMSGWSSLHIENVLKKAGFSEINILDPIFHEKIIWRDVRIEAIK